jgi:thiamine-phosphate pyrophosphorylase
MRHTKIDPRLYLVTDRTYMGTRDIETVVRQAAAGGITMCQLREKECSVAEFVQLGKRLKALLAPFGVPLIINDRLDVALAVGADGVHVGQKDMPYAEARRIMGPDAIIGLSVETLEQAQEAEEWNPDYLGVSPIYPTPTKTDTEQHWGLKGLRELRGASRHTLIAIGGIKAENAGSIIEAGADGVAVVSAICASPNPEEAARQILHSVERAKSRRGGGGSEAQGRTAAGGADQ